MKATFKVTENLTVEFDAESPKSIFETMAELSSTFEDTCCGNCQSVDIRYVIRKVEDNKFYEIHCQNPACRAKLVYGHSKDGKSTYPRRYEIDGKGKAKTDSDGKSVYLKNKGWTKYVPTN